MMPLAKTLGLFLCLLVPILGAQGRQVIHWTDVDEAELGRHDAGLVAMGDLDGDKVPDYAAATVRSSTNPSLWGVVELRSGVDGHLLRRFSGSTTQKDFGTAIARVGDFDNDGLPDLAISSPDSPYGSDLTPGPGEVQVFSTGTGKELLKVLGTGRRFGQALAGIDDVDGDKVPDLVVGAFVTSSASTGAGLLVSGKTGKTLVTYAQPSGFTNYGKLVAVLPDIDKDGVQDVVVGSNPVFNNPQFRVYSGKTGGTIIDVGGESPSYGVVTALRVLPDLDADGKADLAFGIPDAGGSYSALIGEVRVYSTGTAKQLFRFQTPNPSFANSDFGAAIEWLPDQDGDGKPDIIVGDPLANASGALSGAVHVFSTKDGSLLKTIHPPFPSLAALGMGATLATLGDVDGNGTTDFVTACNRPVAVATVKNTLMCVSPVALDIGAEAHAVSLFHGGRQELQVHAGSKRAGSLVLMLGTASGTSPGLPVGSETLFLNADSYFSFTLAAPLAVLWNNLSVLDANGDGGVGFVLPTGLPPSLGGTVLHHSALFLAPGKLDVANCAVRLELRKF
ncbi:MAG: hypothetical protein R3F30_00510 [Planctomycetota bacterium]